MKPSESYDFEHLFQNRKMGKGFKTLFVLYRTQKKNILLSFVFFLIKHSPVWIVPIVTANMINIASDPNESSIKYLWLNMSVIVGILLLHIPAQVLHTSFMSKAARQVEAGLRSTLVRKLQHLSITYHSELRSGKLQSKVLRDVENIEMLSKQMMFTFSAAFTNVVVAIGVTLTKNVLVAFFFIIVIPIAVLITYLFKNKLQIKNREFRKQIETMSGQMAETVEMIPITRAHGLEDIEIKRTDSTLDSLKGKGYKLDIAGAFFIGSGWAIFQIFQMICLLFTSILALKGSIPIGDVVMYQGFFASILMAVNMIINIYPQITKGFESIASITEVLLSNEIVEYRGNRKLNNIEGAFEFENIYFHYKDTDKHVLNNFSLQVKPGECIAFVGESGSGKSTALNMLIGFYKPTSGRLTVDGIPFDELHMQAYRQKIAVVPQNTILFSGSVRENITYGLSNVLEQKLQDVVERANLQDVVNELPEGLNTLIGEHGSKLSGGQRQRIAIARALIRDPQVIVLDEATSALDNISEYQVQKAIKELIHNRTTFIVAHRLSTIRDADRIVVMRKGQCVETGTFQELMECKGEFYQLKQMQA